MKTKWKHIVIVFCVPMEWNAAEINQTEHFLHYFLLRSVVVGKVVFIPEAEEQIYATEVDSEQCGLRVFGRRKLKDRISD